jgi:hypothetical protein
VHTYNPSRWKVETGGSGVQGQSGLYFKTLSQKQNKTPQNKTKQNKNKGLEM